jgi:colanic acid/amylovoran biosynthesis glycosyltransferase
MSSRIAYVINQYPRVSHTFIRREILALERQGFDILRISLQGWDAELADAEDQQERTKTRYVLQKGVPPLLWAALKTLLSSPASFFSALVLAIRISRGAERSLLYHLAYLAEACHMLPWIKVFGATHVHAHFSNNSTEVAMLVNALGGPSYSFTVHGQSELLSGGMAEKVRRAAFVVTISSYGRSQVYRLSNYMSWPKVKVVHCGLEAAFHDVPRTSPPLRPRFVCVGRLSAEKGQLLLIEAAHRLVSKGVEVELVLVGDGEMRKAVEELVARRGLSEQVRITGSVSSNQVREEILSARALVLPSFSEGLPVVIMEAMALRRPVLASCINGIPELVRSGETGWLFPAGSIEDLTAAMEECLFKTPDELGKMGDAGYLRVMQQHSIETEAAKLAELFRNHGENHELV